jgi:hypothetical protein
MGLYQKVSCTQCEQYTQCPQRTRMMVNYCGSRSKDVEAGIREAIAECRSRRGLMFKRETRSIRTVRHVHSVAA